MDSLMKKKDTKINSGMILMLMLHCVDVGQRLGTKNCISLMLEPGE